MNHRPLLGAHGQLAVIILWYVKLSMTGLIKLFFINSLWCSDIKFPIQVYKCNMLQDKNLNNYFWIMRIIWVRKSIRFAMFCSNMICRRTITMTMTMSLVTDGFVQDPKAATLVFDRSWCDPFKACTSVYNHEPGTLATLHIFPLINNKKTSLYWEHSKRWRILWIKNNMNTET